jgi:hypothetical protein
VQVAETEEEQLPRYFAGLNGDPYVTTYRKMLAKDPSLRRVVVEWNWSTFLAIAPWALYRKMWAFLAVVAFGPGLAENPGVRPHHVDPEPPHRDFRRHGFQVAVRAIGRAPHSCPSRARPVAGRAAGEVEDKGVSRTGLVVGSILMIVGTYAAVGTSIAAMHH